MRSEPPDERAADALPPMGLVDRELVEEHLRALVRMRQLDAGDKADGDVRLVREEEMVAVVREEALDGVVDRRRVEEVAGRAHLVVVAGAEQHDLHRLESLSALVVRSPAHGLVVLRLVVSELRLQGVLRVEEVLAVRLPDPVPAQPLPAASAWGSVRPCHLTLLRCEKSHSRAKRHLAPARRVTTVACMTALVLAEPEPAIRDFLERQLRSDGFDVLAFESTESCRARPIPTCSSSAIPMRSTGAACRTAR